MHEYLHNLVHPAFQQAVRGPVMNEGFTEYFTKGVLREAAPVAHLNTGLVRKVEGGIFAPPTTKGLVGPYMTPPSYAANLSHVENVAKKVPGGDNAIRAAYFQGHVEMLGIDPATHAFVTSPPASVDPTLVNVPTGIANLDDLARRSGAPKTEILAANSGLTAAGALPPKLKLPGVREHRVAATFVTAGVGPSETVDQIAAQNGVSVEALKRANPSVTWASLTLGQHLLIPRR
ncbi:MAG: LysM peptidoglycan-binding domain-containing protein [Armatimonadota bacterium]